MERKIVFEVPKAIFYTMSQCRLKSLIPSYLSLSLSLWLIYEVINFKWDLIILVILWPNQIGSFSFHLLEILTLCQRPKKVTFIYSLLKKRLCINDVTTRVYDITQNLCDVICGRTRRSLEYSYTNIKPVATSVWITRSENGSDNAPWAYFTITYLLNKIKDMI